MSNDSNPSDPSNADSERARQAVETSDSDAPKLSTSRLRLLRATERAFLAWLAEGDNAAALDLRPIADPVYRCSYRFAGTCGSIELLILPGGYSVAAMDGGDCWDEFISDDCSVVRREDGTFFCKFSLERDNEAFASREALWRSHLFEQLRKWVEQELRRADRMLLYGPPDRPRTARLEPPERGERSSAYKEIEFRPEDDACS